MDTGLSPAYIKCTYSGHLFPHHLTLPVNVPDGIVPGVEPDVILKDLSTMGVIAAFDAFVDVWSPFLVATQSIGLAELHTVDQTTGEDTFIFAWDVARNGATAAAIVPMLQQVFTFKLTDGRLWKLYAMEGNASANLKAYPPFSAVDAADLVNYAVSDASMIYGRGNAYPFGAVSYTSKFNDALRKQQGLQ